MIQKEMIKFHKPVNQNDIDLVQNIIYPIFSKKNKKEKHYWNKIRSLFLSAMKNANLNFFKRHIFWFYVNRTINKGLKKGKPLIKVEETLRKFIRRRVDDEKDRKGNSYKRAKRSFKLIAEYLIGEKILDLGAGEGFLGLEVKKQLEKDVILVDIVDYNHTELPLILYNPEKKIPLSDKEVDTTILYTVLHHANDPEHLLKEATRITKKRLVIIEGYIEKDDIRMCNCFFDWFYNRVIGDEDITVPLNFLSLKGWDKILKSYGYDIIKTKYLGLNEPLVPEHQILIIADHSNN